MDLTDEQWTTTEPLLPEEERCPSGRRGRPWRSAREVLDGVRRPMERPARLVTGVSSVGSRRG
ncbi:MAG: hypothetical protein C4315_11185 [Chloroflexota bacterium]